ncbi:MAG: DUF1295 domain-containing protein [Acholeplasmatales bacterium]|nr:DUF1295 domain-containing protein [Acholeplasmatales bacterium]
MKNNRALAFIVITIVYIIATIVGIVSYNLLDFYFAINLLIADVIATVVVFIFSLIFKNASVYDPYWSVQPIVIVIGFSINASFNLPRILALITVVLWGIRLTLNWAYTFKGITHQDWRYTMLKEKTGVFYPIVNFLGIHLFPTLVVYLCVLPVAYLFKYNVVNEYFSIIFFITSVFAWVMQGIADIQMQKYRNERLTAFIRIGLWKYSRHPNYLGEILMWWSVSLLVLVTLQNHWFLFIGALVNNLMFMFVSIPMAEKRQMKLKEGFLEYKKETRMLLPIKK